MQENDRHQVYPNYIRHRFGGHPGLDQFQQRRGLYQGAGNFKVFGGGGLRYLHCKAY
jgi:hypothetical protein